MLAREYALAARAAGRGPIAIAFDHVLPNIAPALIVQATIQFAIAILAEAALSYLGLGAQPPQASWGRMLSDAQELDVCRAAPRGLSRPRVALSVLGLNLLGDGLRDALDPKLRSRTDMLLDVADLGIDLPTPAGARRVVDDVSFALDAGENLGVVGESGSGKTMTALALMGLLPDGAEISAPSVSRTATSPSLDDEARCEACAAIASR